MNNEVLKVLKKMPNWNPAETKTTSVNQNSKNDESGIYSFAFIVYFRRFE